MPNEKRNYTVRSRDLNETVEARSPDEAVGMALDLAEKKGKFFLDQRIEVTVVADGPFFYITSDILQKLKRMKPE